MSLLAGRLPVDEHGRIRDDVPARPVACAPPSPRVTRERPVACAPPSPRVTRERPASVRPASVLWREFVAEVAPLHGVDPADVLSSRRTAAIALARRHAWFEIRDRTPLSWPEIGRASGVHHTTAMQQAKKFAREAGLPDWRGLAVKGALQTADLLEKVMDRDEELARWRAHSGRAAAESGPEVVR